MHKLNKIGDIEVFNDFTYQKLQNVFEGKKPTNKTILLMRLFAERNINATEMRLLKEDEIVINNTGADIIDSVNSSGVLYENIKGMNTLSITNTLELLNS